MFSNRSGSFIQVVADDDLQTISNSLFCSSGIRPTKMNCKGVSQSIFVRITLVISLLLASVGAFAPHVFMRSIISRVSLKMVATKEVAMPALSSTMTEGKIVAWNKKVGDKVNAGDVLLVVESDKADMDVEAFEDGYLAAIYTPEGGSAKVGAAVAVLVDSASDIGKVGTTAPAAGSLLLQLQQHQQLHHFQLQTLKQ